MEFVIKPLTKNEELYVFKQSAQISAQTGFIGYLYADMAADDNLFLSTWTDYRKDLKTQKFKDEFDDLINTLREKGNLFSNRTVLSAYCDANSKKRMKLDNEYFGIRIDSSDYVYLFRLNPKKDVYNVYCYCYKKAWLEEHLKKAEKGIRFIDLHYLNLFRVKDGDSVKITFSDSSEQVAVCRYIDDYHVEIGDSLYHICEFADCMERINATVEPVTKEDD